jgi:phosphoribosylaminoimidazolecarboxamide formyltransferase/IMP cyclohydrolase
MVVVNLYPFSEAIKKKDISLEEAIEFIDIGGVSLLRAAAKNFKYVGVICNQKRYKEILEELEKNDCSLSEETLRNLALEAFALTVNYDTQIFNYLNEKFKGKERFPKRILFSLEKVKDLRYGENPHQRAALYKWGVSIGAKQLHGKELSFNNLLDLNSAWELVNEFSSPCAAIIKHNNPCGCALADSLDKAYKYALECDELSAFGGIVGLNRTVDLKTAIQIKNTGFLECIIAPFYEKEALEILREKKDLRILELKETPSEDFDLKKIEGGFLLQEKDSIDFKKEDLKIVTKTKPTQKQLESLIFAFKVAKHVKSNAIVLVRNRRTVGIGAGQMSRVDSVFMAIKKAGKLAKGSVLASDGFFPKEDSIILAKKAGIKSIIQPGGSIKDKRIIQLCNKFGISMVFTGIRHFKH